MNYRNSASYGKRQEFKAIAKLLELGFDVYQTLVDDQGIDCIIRINSNRYLDIQIKARSKTCSINNRAYFPLLKVKPARDNFFFIFYSEQFDSYWILPSKEIVRLSVLKGTNVSQNKTGQNSGKYAIKFAGDSLAIKERFDEYKDEKGFKLIK
ncbi:MAG: hypothetical protein KDC90_09750 [Ignavibacteriae bacterium]|nr:hypothetical protein [Ignavibacteriota bacterium]